MRDSAIPTDVHRQIMFERWSPAVDRSFGEWLTIRPMIKLSVNGTQQPDPRRPSMKVVGTFRAPTEPAIVTGTTKERFTISAGQGGGPMVQLQHPTFSFDAEALPYKLRRGDVIERANGDQYEAHAPQFDSLHLRIYVPTNQLGVTGA